LLDAVSFDQRGKIDEVSRHHSPSIANDVIGEGAARKLDGLNWAKGLGILGTGDSDPVVLDFFLQYFDVRFGAFWKSGWLVERNPPVLYVSAIRHRNSVPIFITD
jgi:hypothetical protein